MQFSVIGKNGFVCTLIHGHLFSFSLLKALGYQALRGLY